MSSFTRSLAASCLLTIDLTELELPNTMKMDFPDPTNVLQFNLTLTPDEGMFILLVSFLNYPYPSLSTLIGLDI